MEGTEETAEVQGAVLPAPLTNFIGYLLRRVFSQFAAQATDGDIDSRDFVVLEALADRDWLSQLDLAERLDINRTIMVSVIDRLEAKGHVVRTRNPDNRRSYVLSLTGTGRDALKAMRQAVGERDRRLTSALTSREHARFNELLTRMQPARTGPTPHTTEYLVAQAHHRVRKLGDDKLAGTGLRVRHYGPLSTLDTLGPCAQQVLAQHLAITEPAAAALIDELVQAGLVQRGRDPRDRRRYALELTPLGRERLRLVEKAVTSLQADIAKMLGSGGDVEFRALLLKLLRQDGSTAPSL
jgi:DNA-binding MarR family transcriptional regulator